MTSVGRAAYETPVFDVSDPMVCHSIQLRPSLWAVVFGMLEGLTHSYSWRQDNPLSATVQEVTTEIRDAVDNSIFGGCLMIGQVLELAVNTVPAWCLLCDGATYANVDYPELAEVIHSGLGVDETHFRVPQRQSRFALGGELVGTQGGEAAHTLTVNEIAPHSHGFENAVVGDTLIGEIPFLGIAETEYADTYLAGDGEAHNNMPPYEVVRFVIVARNPQAGD